ncbi:MAG: hypothetical protein MK101_03805 [Phycisphaerales bacterium]|nr:hypothetical protein [Phycisphaerales bacterium]
MPSVMPLIEQVDDTPEAFVLKHKLGPACEVVAEESDDLHKTLRTLIAEEEFVPAINLLASALPPREALWWAARFYWDVKLDIERETWAKLAAAKAAKIKAEQGKQAEAAIPPPLISSPAPPTGEAAAAAEEAMAPMVNQIKSAMNSPRVLAMLNANPELRTQADAITSIIQRQIDWTKIPSGPSIIPKPSQTGRRTGPGMAAPGGKKPPVPIDPTSLKGRIALRSRRAGGRALASALQWIVNPCQDYANIAGETAQALTSAGPAKALATATFWSGENLNMKPAGAVVPPTPVLRAKGIRATLTNTLNMKGGLLTKPSRLHWCLKLGLHTAEGKEHWDDALEQFHIWTKYRTSPRSPILA